MPPLFFNPSFAYKLQVSSALKTRWTGAMPLLLAIRWGESIEAMNQIETIE